MVASIPVYTGLLSSISYSLVSISLTSSLVIPWPPMKNNCPASYTKFSQTGCYILYCPLQSTFSFLDGSEFTMFSKSLIFCRFPLDSNSFVHPELGLPTYTLLWCISLTGSEQSGISFFSISLMFLLIFLPYFLDLLVLLSITIPIPDSAVLIPNYFWFYICICCIYHYHTLVHYRSLLQFITIFELYAFFTTSLLLGGIHWFVVHAPFALYSLPWETWYKFSPKEGLHMLSISRAK